MDRFGLAFIERLSCFDWLRWVVGVNTKKMVVDEVAGVNAEIMVVDNVKTKRCNGLHTSNRLKQYSNRLNWPHFHSKPKAAISN